MKICLIEDDLELGSALQSALQDNGKHVVWVRLVSAAMHCIEEQTFDAILLDLALPDGNGIELLRYFRGQGCILPILIITAREGLDDRLRGLDLGADDYLVKPFATSELLARLRAVARRSSSWNEAGDSVWKLKDLSLCGRSMRVTRAGTQITLSKTEFAILHELMRNPDRVLTRSELEARALPQSDRQSLDVHMSNLRYKIGGDYIRTVRGVGYLMEK